MSVLKLAPRVLLAPMEGLVDDIMRHTLTQAGTYDACVTAFVRVTNSLLPHRTFIHVAPELRQHSRTLAGTPVWVQLLGSDPDYVAYNARRLAELAPAGIDLNFGCPAPTVNRHRGGAILLDEPELLHRIVHTTFQAIGGRVPLSAKMRLGVRDKGRALEIAHALVDAGAQSLVVHARTKEEGYRPPAHWPWIARIAQDVNVPVIANGDIWTVQDYFACREQSECCDVMLGRGAVADPFLVERIRQALAGEAFGTLEQDWEHLVALLQLFWQNVQMRMLPRHQPGRLKQWLNLLQKHSPQAQKLYQHIRPLNSTEQISVALASL